MERTLRIIQELCNPVFETVREGVLLVVQMKLISIAKLGDGEDHLMILKEVDGERVLAISIGTSEAAAMAVALEKIRTPRPMSHDLMATLIRRLQAELMSVVIHDLRDDMFIGQLDLKTAQGIQEIDCRSSDAVALALRLGAPIYASESVLEAAAVSVEGDSTTPSDTAS